MSQDFTNLLKRCAALKHLARQGMAQQMRTPASRIKAGLVKGAANNAADVA